MLRDRKTQCQEGYEIVLLEELVPQDHLLRKISRAVDFSFIHDLCRDLYCPDNGRPAIPPEMLFKMLLLGYLYGIKSEVKLADMVNENIAFKWFLGLKLAEKGPNHATISINRARRFRDNDIAERIFDEILRQCCRKGLVGGEILYTDSTHVKAKANKHKKVLVTVEETPREYLEALDAQVDLDRQVVGKKAFERDEDDPKGGSSQGKDTTRMQSTTDPDSGQLSKEGKPDGFHYSEHRTVDSLHNVVVNVDITAANIHDTAPLPQLLRQIEQRLGKLPAYMGLDAGYHNAPTAHLLEQAGIQGVIGYRRHSYKTEYFGKWRFHYDPEYDHYICPMKQRLYWRTTNREGYREYYSDSKICGQCPEKAQCMASTARRRQITRHVWQDALDTCTDFVKTAQGRRLYERRKETIERSFAEAKENHGLRYARMLGKANMREQSFLTATVQNIKRLVKAYLLLFRAKFPVLSLTDFQNQHATYPLMHEDPSAARGLC